MVVVSSVAVFIYFILGKDSWLKMTSHMGWNGMEWCTSKFERESSGVTSKRKKYKLPKAMLIFIPVKCYGKKNKREEKR